MEILELLLLDCFSIVIPYNGESFITSVKLGSRTTVGCRRDKGWQSGGCGGFVLVLGGEASRHAGQAQGPRIRPTPPLVPTQVRRLGEASRHAGQAQGPRVRPTPPLVPTQVASLMR